MPLAPHEQEKGETEEEFTTTITLKFEITLYRTRSEQETPTIGPLETTIYFKRDNEEDDRGMYAANAVVYNDDATPIGYDEIQEAFHIDPDAPIWEYEGNNTSLISTIVKQFFGQ